MDSLKRRLSYLNFSDRSFLSAGPDLLTTQPTEILEAIVDYIEEKPDMLHFALVCRKMHSLIIPRHYDFRHIQCRVDAVDVWKCLIENRDLAKNVRRLELTDSYSVMEIPRSIDPTIYSATSLESDPFPALTLLNAALANMVSLLKLVCTNRVARDGYLDMVGETLVYCRTLSEIEMIGVASTPLFLATPSFLSHPSLEVLLLSRTGIDSDIPFEITAHNILPKLRVLHAPSHTVTAILSAPTQDVPRPLDTIKVLDPLVDWDPAIYSALRISGSTLVRLELHSWKDLEQIGRIVDAAPQLAWLDVGEGLDIWAHPVSIEDWCRVLARLRYLTTFHGVQFFKPGIRNWTSNKQTAELLVRKCPLLRTVDAYQRNSRTQEVIILSGGKNTAQWELVKADTRKS